VGAEWEKLYTAALQKKFLWVKNENLDWKKVAQT
jgi:DNA topoisomerase-1